MIDFPNARNIVTPKGEIIKIDCGDEILWQKAYKQELSYLESTGTQWINTGYYPQFGDRVEFKNVLVSEGSENPAVFSAGTADPQFVLLRSYGQGSIVGYYKCFASGDAPQVYKTLDNFTTIVVDSDGSLFYNGECVAISTPANVELDSPLHLFIRANKKKHVAHVKIGEVMVTRNGTIIHDFVPVRDWDDRPCMYDKATGEYFYNQGTDEFLYG